MVIQLISHVWLSPGGSGGKESTCNAEDPGSIPGSRRSPGERDDFPLQYSCLENSMDRGAGRLQFMGSQRDSYTSATNTVKARECQKCVHMFHGLPGNSNSEEYACSTGDLGSIPGLERSPGEGNGYPLQCSCLENSIYIHGVVKSQIQLSD